jgi:hypothetical protein
VKLTGGPDCPAILNNDGAQKEIARGIRESAGLTFRNPRFQAIIGLR